NPRAWRRSCRKSRQQPSPRKHSQPPSRGRACWLFLVRVRLHGIERKLLSRHGCLVHGAALHDREYGHSFVIGATDGGGVILVTAGVSTGAGRSGGATRGRGYRHRTDARFEFKVPIAELFERPLVFKEDDL